MTGVAQQAVNLDRSGTQPLYAQIVQALLSDIRQRRLAPGTVLPSESALCHRFGVARSVVRQALSVLVSEGVIHREPGRAPIVAATTEHKRLVQRSTGLFDQFASTGTSLRTKVLRLEPASPPPDVVSFFGTDDVWMLERLRGVDEAPLAFVRTWLPRERIPTLRADSLHDASLHGVLAEQYGLKPGRGRNRIRAVAADAALAAALTVEKGSPLLMLEGQGLDMDGRPLEWFTTWHRAEQLVFDVEVSPVGEQLQAIVPSDVAGHEAAFDAIAATAETLAELEQNLTSALENVRRLRSGTL